MWRNVIVVKKVRSESSTLKSNQTLCEQVSSSTTDLALPCIQWTQSIHVCPSLPVHPCHLCHLQHGAPTQSYIYIYTERGANRINGRLCVRPRTCQAVEVIPIGVQGRCVLWVSIIWWRKMNDHDFKFKIARTVLSDVTDWRFRNLSAGTNAALGRNEIRLPLT